MCFDQEMSQLILSKTVLYQLSDLKSTFILSYTLLSATLLLCIVRILLSGTFKSIDLQVPLSCSYIDDVNLFNFCKNS